MKNKLLFKDYLKDIDFIADYLIVMDNRIDRDQREKALKDIKKKVKELKEKIDE